MTFFYPIDPSRDLSWQGYTLIVPSVSVGNVGQLAVDLIISTLVMEKVGIILDDSITPLVGNDPFHGCISSRVGTIGLQKCDSPRPFSLMTSCEVFESKSHQLVVIQLRSPLIRGRKGTFRRKLVDFAKSYGFRQTILMTSMHSHERLDSQLTGDQFRFVATPTFNFQLPDSWKRLEDRPVREEHLGQEINPYMPGGGIAKPLFHLCTAEQLPLAVLVVFCSEGDNVPEAFQIANRLNDLLGVIKPVKDVPGWKVPVSWSALFGNPAVDQELVFG